MFLEPPVTPKQAKMRGDKSPICPPLTPIPSQRREVQSNVSASASSETDTVLTGVVSGLRKSPSRSNGGTTPPPSAAAASATGCKANIGVDSSANSSSSSPSTGRCESGQHRERLAQLTAKIQRADQQQLRLTGVSVALAVGLFYLLLERMGLKQRSLSFTFATYIPVLHVLPALCAFCIVWLRLPERLPQSTSSASAPTAAPAAAAATGCPAGLEEELLNKYVSRKGLAVVRQSEEIHYRFANCVLRALVCSAVSDLFAAYVQFWPLLHTPTETRASLPTAAAPAAERPAIFGPPPPGVYREGFERYPPEGVPLRQRSIFSGNSTNYALFICAQRAAVVFTYLLRVLAAVWTLKAAHAVAPGTKVVAATEDTKKQHKQLQQQSKDPHRRKWTAYVKRLPGGAYAVHKLCVVLGLEDGAMDDLVDYCCSRDAARQLLFSLFSSFLLFRVWRTPLSMQRPSGLLSLFSRTPSTQEGGNRGCLFVAGLLGAAALQLLVNALLPFVKYICATLLRNLHLPYLSVSSRFYPPSCTSVAAVASRRNRPPVQQACLSLLVAALLLEVFSTLVGLRALFHLFMQSGPQPQLMALADAVSKGERVLICSAAVAHTLAAFVLASASTCCSLRNYFISKIFRNEKVDEQEVLGGEDNT